MIQGMAEDIEVSTIFAFNIKPAIDDKRNSLL
jgi:hypothetical protein